VGQPRQMSLAFEALAATRGSRARLSLIRSLLLPSPRNMRAWYRLATRGTAGLGAAYVTRLLRVPVFIAPALMSRWQARRHARRHGLR
jgi:hypothetical protein